MSRLVSLCATAHGGPDAFGAARWDFSTNANACGPAPMALRAVQDADPTRYPDPQSTRVRAKLAALHGVPPGRIVVAASGSEFIQRLTAVVARHAPHAIVRVPASGYGDYARAAQACELAVSTMPVGATLVWHAEPSSPLGWSAAAPAGGEGALVVVDAAYEPLRLEGDAPPMPAHAWRLMSPNKALGLTGVRGAYAIAPANADEWLHALVAAAPSWPLGAHAVAMLEAWSRDDTQRWVEHSLATLREWKQAQLACCEALGWACEPSVTPFFVARDPRGDLAAHDPALRAEGVKLRDAASFGLPGAVRLSVQAPQAQQALCEAWQRVMRPAVSGSHAVDADERPLPRAGEGRGEGERMPPPLPSPPPSPTKGSEGLPERSR